MSSKIRKSQIRFRRKATKKYGVGTTAWKRYQFGHYTNIRHGVFKRKGK